MREERIDPSPLKRTQFLRWARAQSSSLSISGDAWPDDARLSDIEERFTCRACGKRGADVRPDFNWNKKSVGAMGYR
jgi:hypothetical protein